MEKREKTQNEWITKKLLQRINLKWLVKSKTQIFTISDFLEQIKCK